MAINTQRLQMDSENRGQLHKVKSVSVESHQSEKKKQVFGDKKNFMHNLDSSSFFDGGVVSKREASAFPTPSSVRRNKPKPKQQDFELSLMLEEPSSDSDYLLDCLDSRECCSEENYKPDWSVWAEMNGQEFEDSGICSRSFSFQEDSSDYSFNDTHPNAKDLDSMFDEMLPSFDSILEGEDLDDSIKLELPEMPEMPDDDLFNFGCPTP